MSGGWAAEYDRRVAAGARTREAGNLGYRQVQDDHGNWFHRAPGNIDCPCGRDERTGQRVDPFVSAPADAGEMIGGHYIPFWRLEEHLAELAAAELARAEAAATPEPAPALYLVPEPDYPGPTGESGQVTRAS